jgi:hypothetical protein
MVFFRMEIIFDRRVRVDANIESRRHPEEATALLLCGTKLTAKLRYVQE